MLQMLSSSHGLVGFRVIYYHPCTKSVLAVLTTKSSYKHDGTLFFLMFDRPRRNNLITFSRRFLAENILSKIARLRSMTILLSVKCIWCLDVVTSSCAASLQALKPDITHTTSCRNVISIEHTTGLVLFLLLFGQFCNLEKGWILYGLVTNV